MFVHFHTLFHSVSFALSHSSSPHKRECWESKPPGIQSRFGIFICWLNPCSSFSRLASITWLCWYSFSTLNGNMASDICIFLRQRRKQNELLEEILGRLVWTSLLTCDLRQASVLWRKPAGNVPHGLTWDWWIPVEYPTTVNIHIVPWTCPSCIAFFQLLAKQVCTCSRFWEVVPLRHFWVPSQTRGSSCFYPSYSPACASTCCCSLESALASAGAAFGPFSTLVHRTRPWCSGSGGWWAAWSLCTRPSGWASDCSTFLWS